MLSERKNQNSLKDMFSEQKNQNSISQGLKLSSMITKFYNL